MSRREPLKEMSSVVDRISTPGLRKTLTKFVADERSEILQLYAQGKAKAAQRRERGAWVCMTSYIVKAPLAALVLALIKRRGVGG
jgi:hypothetical protein